MDSKYKCIEPVMADANGLSTTKVLCSAYVGDLENFAVTFDSSYSLAIGYRIQFGPQEGLYITACSMQTATSVATSGITTNYFANNVAGFLRIEASATRDEAFVPGKVLIHGMKK